MAEYRDIEDLLVWAFRDQQIEHFVSTLRSGSIGPSGSIGSALAETLILGTRVDGGSAGAKFLGARCHDDALTIYEAVMMLPPEAWVEVVKHARTATQPEWHPEGPGRWVLPLDKNGEPKRIWRDPDRRRGDLGLAPAQLEGTSPMMVELSRATYRLWHTTLGELVPLVNRELETYQAEPPKRLAEPWHHRQRRVA